MIDRPTPELRLSAAIEREKNRISRLKNELELETERGFERAIQNRIKRSQTLLECLQYALNLVEGLRPRDPFEP